MRGCISCLQDRISVSGAYNTFTICYGTIRPPRSEVPVAYCAGYSRAAPQPWTPADDTHCLLNPGLILEATLGLMSSSFLSSAERLFFAGKWPTSMLQCEAGLPSVCEHGIRPSPVLCQHTEVNIRPPGSVVMLRLSKQQCLRRMTNLDPTDCSSAHVGKTCIRQLTA